MQINPYLNFNGNCEEAFNFSQHYTKPEGNYVSINVDTLADARRIFEGLAQKA